MPVTTGMVGQGFYDRNSAPQWAAIEAMLPWLEETIAEMHLANLPPTISVADFGCSEGRNSIQIMQRLIPAIRARTSRPIQTIHSDLPTNDYAALLRGLRSDGRSVFGDDVFSTVVGGSMFDQLLPPRSTHLAMTFNAIGYLSRRPLERLPDYILPDGPSARCGVGAVSAEDRAVFAAQALADVETFLRARASELVAGGRLLIQVFGAGEGVRTGDGIFDVLNDAILELLDVGTIDRASYEAFYQPIYFRTLEELVGPVASGAAELGSLFRLERAETYEVEVPFVEDFRRSGDIGAFARRYTDFFRAPTEPVLRAAFAPRRPDDLVDEIFARAERLIRQDPERYEFRYVSVAVLLTRRESGDQSPPGP